MDIGALYHLELYPRETFIPVPIWWTIPGSDRLPLACQANLWRKLMARMPIYNKLINPLRQSLFVLIYAKITS